MNCMNNYYKNYKGRGHIINAKEQFQLTLDESYTSDGKELIIKCARVFIYPLKIHSSPDFKQLDLPSNYTTKQLESFYKSLDFEFDSGDGPIVTGIV